MTNEKTKERVIAHTIKTSRNIALDAAIGVCKTIADDDGTAQECVLALEDLRRMMNIAGVASDEAKQ